MTTSIFSLLHVGDLETTSFLKLNYFWDYRGYFTFYSKGLHRCQNVTPLEIRHLLISCQHWQLLKRSFLNFNKMKR